MTYSIPDEHKKRLEGIYNYVQVLENKLETLMENWGKPVDSFNYLFTQYTHCERFPTHSFEEDLADLRENLINVILERINYEVDLIRKTCVEYKILLTTLSSYFQAANDETNLRLNGHDGVTTILISLNEIIETMKQDYKNMMKNLNKAIKLEGEIDKSEFTINNKIKRTQCIGSNTFILCNNL